MANPNFIEEFGEHTCEVCGTDCGWCDSEIDSLNKKVATLEAERRKTEAELATLRDENAVLRDAVEVGKGVVDALASELNDDISDAIARCTVRRFNEAIGIALPRLLREKPEGQNLYGLRWKELKAELAAVREENARLKQAQKGEGCEQ